MSQQPKHFSTDKRKKLRISNALVEQSQVINKQESKNKSIKENTHQLKVGGVIIKKIRDEINSVGSEWESMDVLITNPESPSPSDIQTQYKSWEIVIDRLHEVYIPFINVEIAYRVGSGGFDDESNIFPYKQVLIGVEELNALSENSIKKVTIHASVFFTDTEVSLNYEARLILSIPNPQKDS